MKKTVGNWNTNMEDYFQKFILKPRIAVKSFAKEVSCSEKPDLRNILELPENTHEELLKNLEIVISDVATDDDVEISDNFQQSESVGVDYFEKQVRSKTNNRGKVPNNINTKSVKRMFYYPISKNHEDVTEIPSDTLVSQEEAFEQAPSKDPEKDVNERIFCDLCNETFKDGVLYSLHSINHSDNNKYSCHACKYSTVSKKNIAKHVAAHERKTLYNCDICKKGFTCKSNAMAHMNVHTGDKPFVCDICGRGFGSASVFANHRRHLHWQMLGLTPFKYDCQICNKSFKGSTCRDRHYKRHHTQDFDESELCDICGKRLSNKEKLKFHRRTHTGYKPFDCNVCAKSFSRKEQLKEHMRVHSGEKPYKCRHCSKGFTQRSSLKIHERIHTGERPYICHLCNKGFTSKGVLDLHLKRCEGVSEGLD